MAATHDALLTELVRAGFSSSNARQLIDEAADAAIAKRRADQAIARVAAEPYLEWLRRVSPELNWEQPVHRLLGEKVDAILRGDLKRLMISMPPRIGKSEALTMRLPVRFLQQRPDGRVIVAAYNRELAKSFVARSLRLFRRLAPDMLEKETEDEWTTKPGGSVLAVGVGSGVTGRGGDCLVGETRVLTPVGAIPIADIVAANKKPPVYAYDVESGKIVERQIVAVKQTTSDYLFRIYFARAHSIVCTGDHRFFTPNSSESYVAAKDLLPGSDIYFARNGATVETDTVVQIAPLIGRAREVYDIQVDGCHNFFANGVLVHNCIIIDDPTKNYAESVSPTMQEALWQWWINDIRTRRNDMERTPVVIIATRWSEDDLIGKILGSPDGENWDVVSFPAIAGSGDILGRSPGESIWPERMPVEELEHLRLDMGLQFESLYQQDPAPLEGALFRSDWFTRQAALREGATVIAVRFWDLAESSVKSKNLDPDYTAGTLEYMSHGAVSFSYTTYDIADVARIRAEPDERDAFIEQVAIADKELRGCDLQVFEQTSKAETIRLRDRLAPHGIQVDSVISTKDKVTRSTNLRSDMGSGRVGFSDCWAPWMTAFRAECLHFPGGKHDDQVDSASGAHNYLVARSLLVEKR